MPSNWPADDSDANNLFAIGTAYRKLVPYNWPVVTVVLLNIGVGLF